MPEKIVIKNLYKIFGRRADEARRLLDEGFDKETIHAKTGSTVGVADASMTINAGEIFVVMGLSGSGKSTLIRMLNRLIEPTSGEIIIDGRDITKMSRNELIELRRKDMSMVFQSFALMPHLSVLENAAFGLAVAGAPRDEQVERAMHALEQVGLKAYAESMPDELSGGMQQRVGLARALAANPTVMLMDEAFSALDPLIRAEMQDELLRLQEEHERTIVFISHDLDEAMRIGDRIAIMEGGRVVQVGTPEEILSNPADEYVRSFFSGVDVSKVLTAGDIARMDHVTVIDRHDDAVRGAITRLQKYDREFGYLVDRRRRFHGVVSIDTLRDEAKAEKPSLQHAALPDVQTVSVNTHLSELLGVVAQAPYAVPVVDDEGIYRGTISRTMILETLDRAS